jgi:hypothetical protein
VVETRDESKSESASLLLPVAGANTRQGVVRIVHFFEAIA